LIKAHDTVDAARLHRDEIAATEAELKKTEAAIERYMHAFESGSVSEDMFGTRVRDLGNKVRALRSRHAELAEAAEEVDLNPPTAADIEALRQMLENEIERGSEENRKAIAQAFVSDLVVEERDTIQPTFYVRGELPPDCGATGEPPSDEKGFRAMAPTVGAAGLEPTTSAV
jgi:site-specific DNA recombinase